MHIDTCMGVCDTTCKWCMRDIVNILNNRFFSFFFLVIFNDWNTTRTYLSTSTQTTNIMSVVLPNRFLKFSSCCLLIDCWWFSLVVLMKRFHTRFWITHRRWCDLLVAWLIFQHLIRIQNLFFHSVANPVYDRLTLSRAANVRRYNSTNAGQQEPQLNRERETSEYPSFQPIDAEEITTTV